MAKEFKLPDLGEGIHEAQVINVSVNVGDRVDADQTVMEVETDKAAVELPVPFAGVIASLNVKTGDTVTVGQVLLAVSDGGEPVAAKSSKRGARSEAGVAKRSHARSVPSAPAVRSAAVAEAPRRTTGPVPAAPAVRRLARELKIDLHQVRGTGPGGRIVREDVERFSLAGPTGREAGPRRTAPSPEDHPAVRAVPTSAARPSAGAGVDPLPDFSKWGPIRRERIPQIRKAIARQMARAWAIIPHVTHADEADVTDLEGFRKEQGRVFADKGAKLTLTSFLVKAVTGTLQQFPQLNASFDEAASELILKDYIHIGIAVDTPRGLMVPVLRDADQKSLMQISAEMTDLADRAREFKTDIAEMRGGSFTITNVGALGGTMSTPMINYPEVAILGVGRLGWRPIVRDGEVVPRKVLPLFLSFDHRVVDGADGARFLNVVISFLENPLNLLLVS
ncbi:MAG: 2-oxo acid dehydrogenase subunit E2 [Phycisphaerae bacterium]